MEITPVAATSFVVLNALSSNDGFRDGRVLQAKVMEMLSDKLARLAIDGQAVAIKTDKPLPIGTTLTLRVERQDGQLKLISQGQGQGQQAQGEAASGRSLPNAPQNALPNLAEPMKIALAKIHAMTVEAALANNNKTTAPGGGLQAPGAARLQAEAAIAKQATPDMTAQLRQTASPNQPLPGSVALPTGNAARPADGAIRQFLLENQPQQQAASTARAPLEPLNIRHVTADGTTIAQQKSAQPQAPMPAPAPNPLATGAKAAPSIAEGLEAALRQSASDPALAQKSAPATPVQADISAARPAAPDAQGAARQNPAAQAPLNAAQPAPNNEAAEARPRAAAAEMLEGVQRSTTDMLNAQPRAERFATWTVELPLFLPGSATPLRLDIVRDDEPAAQSGGEKRAPAWMVRFDSDTASLGRIRAAISLIDGHIGVHLWAERPDTANWFQQNAGQLRTALVASDLALDSVTVAQIGANGEGAL